MRAAGASPPARLSSVSTCRRPEPGWSARPGPGEASYPEREEPESPAGSLEVRPLAGLGLARRRRRHPRALDVERRFLRRVAVGAEAGRVEVVAQRARSPLGVGLHRDVVLARARRAAVAEQVVALRVGLDAG